MPEPARHSSPDGPFFHVVRRSAHARPLFQRPTDYRAFLGVLHQALEHRPVRLISYCVLANRWHLVVGPVGRSELSRFLRWVATTHTALWRTRPRGTDLPLYDVRPSCYPVEAAGQLMRICCFVERRALRVGLVRRAQDWPWCSLSERLQGRPRVPVVTTPFLVSDTWLGYVNAAAGLEERRRQARAVAGLAGRRRPEDGNREGDVASAGGSPAGAAAGPDRSATFPSTQ